MFGEMDEDERGVEVKLIAEIVVKKDGDEEAQTKAALDELRGMIERCGLPVNLCSAKGPSAEDRLRAEALHVAVASMKATTASMGQQASRLCHAAQDHLRDVSHAANKLLKLAEMDDDKNRTRWYTAVHMVIDARNVVFQLKGDPDRHDHTRLSGGMLFEEDGG